MFDIGFWELTVIAVIALIILGPEKLPRAAREAGLWFGKTRRTLGKLRMEIERELDADEVRQVINENKSLLKNSADESVQGDEVKKQNSDQTK